jgi:hypothetical protein
MKEMLALFGARRVHKHTKNYFRKQFPRHCQVDFFHNNKTVVFCHELHNTCYSQYTFDLIKLKGREYQVNSEVQVSHSLI